MRLYYSQAILILLSMLLASCMVGPDFHSPLTPKTQSYTASPRPVKTISVPSAGKASNAQYFIAGQDVPAEWWYLFRSPELDGLIRQGLANSPTLAAATAALTQAQENLRAQIGNSYYPAITAGFSAERQRFNQTLFGSPGVAPNVFNLFNANVNAAYTLDVFGGLRRGVEASRAQVDFQKYQWDAAYLTLTANIVTTSIMIASVRAQVQATHELIRYQENLLILLQNQFRLGGISRANVLTQESQLGQTRATLPPLEQILVQNLNALSVLVGELPSESQLPSFNLDKIQLPQRIPISLPSLLVKQRPDIQASEALLHVASAQVGVATANLYPQVTINASYAWEDNALSSLFNPNNKIWNVTGNILQPIFNGGALIAKKCAAVAAYEQAAAQYRQTVLTAFQNVANALRALQHDAETLKAQKEAETAAHGSLILTEKQYRLGAVNYINLFIAQSTYQQTRIARIQAQAARYADTAALFQALGGGWWNREKSLRCPTKPT